jgi:hypothetical protein
MPNWHAFASARAHLARLTGTESGTRFAQADSPWPAPFPPPPPRPSGVVRRLPRYYGSVRLPTPVHHRRTPLGFPMRPAANWPQTTVGSPGSRARCFRACAGSQTARGPVAPRDLGTHQFCLPPASTASAPRTARCCGDDLSRLNGRPARSPVNASRGQLPAPMHDSGPAWVANPSPYRTLIYCTSPVLTGARKPSPPNLAEPGPPARGGS